MTHAELKQRMLENPDLFVVDIREAEELDRFGMYTGANHISMGRMFIKAAEGSLPKEAEIVVYCASGTRAGIVAQELSPRGYTVHAVSEPITQL